MKNERRIWDLRISNRKNLLGGLGSISFGAPGYDVSPSTSNHSLIDCICGEEAVLALLKHLVGFNSTVNSIVLISSRKKGYSVHKNTSHDLEKNGEDHRHLT
jgi:hypothetical protein